MDDIAAIRDWLWGSYAACRVTASHAHSPSRLRPAAEYAAEYAYDDARWGVGSTKVRRGILFQAQGGLRHAFIISFAIPAY